MHVDSHSVNWLSVSVFFGSLKVPPASFPTISCGLVLLFLANLTWTASWATTTRGRLIRLLLAPPAIYFFYRFAYGDDFGDLGRFTVVGMNVVGLYGIMEVLQVCIIGLRDQFPPMWVDIPSGHPLPMPTSFRWRALYAFDLTTSLRGTSWFAGRNFDWCPTGVRIHQQSAVPRRTFLRKAAGTLLLQYLIVDFFDTLNKRRHWPTNTMHPVTSLPWPEQLLSAFSVCVGTITAIIVEHTAMAAIFVVLGAPTEGWPPMFASPFGAASLSDLWTRRWHAIFRRSFDRLSIPVLSVLPAKYRPRARPFVAFWLSATLHMLIMHRLETNEHFLHPKFADSSVLKFFVSQPFALILEHAIIAPLSKRYLAKRWQTVPTQIWAWMTLLFTGRYWADVWVRRGLWGPTEKVVGFSVVRGLWKGQWTV